LSAGRELGHQNHNWNQGNEVAHSLHQSSGDHFSESPPPKNDPSQHEVVGIDKEEDRDSRAETPRPIEWSKNKELPPVPQKTLRRTTNNPSVGVVDVEKGTNMKKIESDGLSVRDKRDKPVVPEQSSMGSKVENKELPIQTQPHGQENDSKLKIKD
jgi:hypothetical protein